MEILRKYSVSDVGKRWKNQYLNAGNWRQIHLDNGLSSKQVFDQITIAEKVAPFALDAIDQIIGHNGWTHNHCSHCLEATRDPLMSFDVNGGEYQYNLCVKCLEEAHMKLVKD